jgi:hypothetical protein
MLKAHTDRFQCTAVNMRRNIEIGLRILINAFKSTHFRKVVVVMVVVEVVVVAVVVVVFYLTAIFL